MIINLPQTIHLVYIRFFLPIPLQAFYQIVFDNQYMQIIQCVWAVCISANMSVYD